MHAVHAAHAADAADAAGAAGAHAAGAAAAHAAGAAGIILPGRFDAADTWQPCFTGWRRAAAFIKTGFTPAAGFTPASGTYGRRDCAATRRLADDTTGASGSVQEEQESTTGPLIV